MHGHLVIAPVIICQKLVCQPAKRIQECINRHAPIAAFVFPGASHELYRLLR